MKNIFLFFLLILILFNSGFSQKPPVTIDPNATKEISSSINSFAFDLYREVNKQEGNLFFSPYSISSALAMTYAGAKGNTEKQMARFLYLNLPQERLHSSFGMLQSYLNSIQKKGDIKLSIARRQPLTPDPGEVQASLSE